MNSPKRQVQKKATQRGRTLCRDSKKSKRRSEGEELFKVVSGRKMKIKEELGEINQRGARRESTEWRELSIQARKRQEERERIILESKGAITPAPVSVNLFSISH